MFLLVPAHPGCPGQIPQSRKTVVCCVCVLMMMYVTGVLKEFQEYYKITNAQVGLMQTAFIVAYMLFSLAFGYIGDRFNRKIIISVGIFGWSAVMFFSSFVGPNVSFCFLC